ncbi:DJ-1/PfpI family protein [Anaerosporobacter sp.]
MNVSFFIYDNVESIDFIGPHSVFYFANKTTKSNLFELFTFSKDKGSITTQSGLNIETNYSIADIKKKEIEVLVLPGGSGSRSLIYNDELLKELNCIINNSKLVLSVCTGALLLTKLGLVSNMRIATHRNVIELIHSLDNSVKVDTGVSVIKRDNIYTTAGVCTGIDGALEVLKEYVNEDVIHEIENNLYYIRYIQ